MIILPLTSDPYGQVLVNVGRTSYIFETYFTPLQSVWVMDIMDSIGNLLLSGISLIHGIDNLLKGHGDLFSGSCMQVVCLPGTDIRTLSSLGTTAQVIWFDSSEQNPLSYPDPLMVV